MTEPSYALQKAVYDALIAASIPEVGAKVFHTIPSQTALPYIETGHNQIIGEDDAGSFFRAFVEVVVFAKSAPKRDLIVSAVHTALDRILTLDGFSMHEHHYDGSTPITEVVGSDIIEQSTVRFEYLIQTLS